MATHRKALESLIDDVDAIKEDLVDPMAHSHPMEGNEVLDCLACIMLARLSNAVEFVRKDYLAIEQEGEW